MKTKWKTLSGEKIDDIQKFVDASTREGQEVHIGTDSLQSGKFTQFVTVVVIHTPMKGGRVAYARDVVPRIGSLRHRLMDEVWRSVNLAIGLTCRGAMTIHIDANAQERHMSSRYLQELVGLVVGQGFKALWKPDSWAASHAADHVIRTRGKLPRDGDVAAA